MRLSAGIRCLPPASTLTGQLARDLPSPRVAPFACRQPRPSAIQTLSQPLQQSIQPAGRSCDL